MAQNVGSIYYTVEADTAKLLSSAAPVDKSLGNLATTFGRTDKAASQASFQMTKTAQAVRNLGNESKGASNQLSGLTKVFGGLLTLQGAKGLLSMAEGYTEMADRVTIATSSVEEYEMVQRRLLATSNATERALSEAQELFLQSAQGIKDLGYTTDQTLDITDSLSHAFAANAASAQSASTAITAFSKATIRGKIDSMGWISIMTAAPTLLNDIAAAAGKSTAEINQMGVDGEVSAQMLTEGLRQSLEANRALDAAMSKTVAGSFTKLRNNLSAFVGEANRSTGATQIMADAVGYLADNIESIAKVLTAVGAGALARYITQLGASTVAKAAGALAAQKQAAEELKLAKANAVQATSAANAARATAGLTTTHSAAAGAANNQAIAMQRLAAAQRATITSASGLLAVLGGPVGIVALIAAAATGISLFGSKTTEARPPVDMLTGSVNALGDAALRLQKIQLGEKIAELESLGSKAAKAGARAEYLQAQLDQFPHSKEAANWSREMADLEAAIEKGGAELEQYRNRLKEVNEELGKRKSAPGGPGLKEELTEGGKYIANLEKQNDLLRLQGEERVRLKVAQDLQGKATEVEIALAQEAAVEQYRLEQAQKSRTAATKEGAKAENENAKVIAKLQEELLEAAFGGEALAESKHLASLNKFATPEEVAVVKQLSAALHEVKEAERLRKELGQVDAIEGEKHRHEEQMRMLREQYEAQGMEHERFLELKFMRELEHAENLAQIREEEFRQQSEWNEILMSTLDNLEQATTDAITGLVTGATTGTQALQALGQAILKDVVGSFVKMGVEHVKAIAMGRAAQSAAGAAYAAATAGQVKATTALAGQAAFASTAAIPIVGPKLAPAAAKAATAAAAGLGAPAIAASVVAGNRQHGGPVAAGSMYRINEGGKPEILNTADGRQWLLPNQRGNVISNREASGGGAINVTNHFVISTSWPLSESEIRELAEQINEAVENGTRLIASDHRK